MINITSLKNMTIDQLKSIRGIELQKMYKAEESIDKILRGKGQKSKMTIWKRKRESAIEKIDKINKEIVKKKEK